MEKWPMFKIDKLPVFQKEAYKLKQIKWSLEAFFEKKKDTFLKNWSKVKEQQTCRRERDK